MSSEHTNCSCKEMFIEPPTDNDISLDIKSAIVDSDTDNEYELKDIFDDIKVSYDAELILRYQEANSAKIVYLIFSRVINYLDDEVFATYIINKVIEINVKFSKDQNNFPANSFDRFNIIITLFTTNHSIRDNFIQFYKSVSIFYVHSESKFDREWNDNKYLNPLFNRILDNTITLNVFKKHIKGHMIKHMKYHLDKKNYF